MGRRQQEANQGSGINNAVIVQLVDQLAVLLEGTLHLAAEEQSSKTSDDETADNGEVEPDLQHNGNDGQDQGIQRSILLLGSATGLSGPSMAGLALLQEEASQDGGDDNRDDQSGIAPLASVPAQGEVGHLIDFDEESTILSEVDGVQIDTSGNRTP